jgi:hypothetical protein
MLRCTFYRSVQHHGIQVHPEVILLYLWARVPLPISTFPPSRLEWVKRGVTVTGSQVQVTVSTFNQTLTTVTRDGVGCGYLAVNTESVALWLESVNSLSSTR